MKKKGKKSKPKEDDSNSDQSDADNRDSPGKRSRASKTRLRRRRREGSHIRSDSDSSEEDRKPKKRQKRRKRSRTTTGTSEESSSDWDDGSQSGKGSEFTTEETKSKPKEVTEKDLVEKIQKMVPYAPLDSPLWTKWTLAPLYHFIRNPNAMLLITLSLKITDDKRSPIPTVIKRFLKLYQIAPETCPEVLVTFNQLIPEYTGEYFYFVKSASVKIDSENFEEVILYGNTPAGHSHIQAFNSILTYYWTPILIEDESLPKEIKDEILTDLNTLSCSSQTSVHLLTTQEILLFVPKEASDPETSGHALSKDKEFCTRLEETVIYWLTKLKQLLLLKELDDTDGWPGPLDEISFWQSRTQNLSGVLTQFKTAQVKKLIQILASNRSPYLPELRSIFAQVGDAHHESASNFHYLQTLIQPCTVFPSIKLSEVKTTMQKYLWLVLIIKRNAPFYKTAKRLNGLLRKFSNVLITMCRRRIKLNSLLQGQHIKTSEKTITQCLKCLNWWKQVYSSAEQMCMGKGEWSFDYDQIFTHVEAMISRLNDLLEICIVQRLYGRKLDDSGESCPLPLYPGVKGYYISRLMEKIRVAINSKMEDLAKISDLVLNVRNTEWISHMNNFQAEVLSGEMSIQNLLEEVFDQMSNLRQRLDLLQLFYVFYSRDIIMRQIDKLAIQLYEYFEEQVLHLRKLFELKIIPLPKTYSHMAGRGAWATYMKRRIESHLDLLKKAEDWLPKSLFGDTVKSEAKSLSESIATFSQQTYDEWSTSKEIVDGKDFRAKLEIPLLVRGGRDQKDIVKINFDRNIFRILTEAEIWARVGRPVPLVLLMSIYSYRENLHNTRESISLVAKCYNEVISKLSRDERLLFSERLLPLEKKIYPCLTSYTWSSCLAADQFSVDEFQVLAREIMGNINAYQTTNSKVADIVLKISRMLMVQILPKKIYEPDEFRSIQNELITQQLKRIVRDYQNIAKLLRELFKIFHGDGPEVKVQWGKYVKLVDDCVEEALSLSLRNSLKILEESVCSPNKPLFVLKMKLEDNTISFQPELEDFAGMIFGVKRNIALALEHLSKISRYTGSPADLAKTERSFTNALLNDPASIEIQERIKFSIEKCFSELNLYSERWSPYRDIWEVDRSTFMDQYGHLYPSIAAYEKDMAKYVEVADIVNGSENFVNIRFIRLDCTHMKAGISVESLEWFQLIAGTLYKKAKGTLQDIYGYMEGNKKKFSEEPKTLDDQLGLFLLLENVKSESRQKSSLFPVIKEQFGILNKFQFQIESEVNDQFLGLKKEWKDYQNYLKEADRTLQKSYDKLRNAFLECCQSLKEKADELLKSFEQNGPFSKEALISGLGETSEEDYFEVALTSLENFQNDVTALIAEDTKLISSLQFFKINRDPNPILIALQSEIKDLILVWGHVKQWESNWIKWKSIRIESLHNSLADIDQVSAAFLLEFTKLDKQFEQKSWPVISESIQFIKNVQASLRTVDYLNSTSLRTRHWERIKSYVGDSKYFPHDVSRPGQFNLATVVNLGLYRYTDQLSLISVSSGKETVIEHTLKNIEDFWTEESFILEQKKGLVPFQIRCGPRVQDQLMDHIVSLSAMKGSPFIWPFQEKVDYWGKLLPLMDQVLGQLLATQKEWLFLEKVFLNEDIRKEMPRHAKQFTAVSQLWATLVLVITEETSIAKVVESTDNFPEMLEDIEEQMERLRKDLQNWLQEKRQEFPRLYFIPDHELLECLGNPRDPREILPILQKLFGNLAQLKVTSSKSSKIVQIQGIISATGESLTFPQALSADGSLTSWLTDLELSIKSSVKLDMLQCLEILQLNPNKQEECLLEMKWLCQSYLTGIHIQWTADATKTIILNGDSEPVKVDEKVRKDFTFRKMIKKFKKTISKLAEILKGLQTAKPEVKRTTTLQRLKLKEVLVKLIHLRDVTERLHSRNCSDPNSFEWLQYIRIYLEDNWATSKHEMEYGVVVLKQGFAGIEYTNEFIGWGQGFVITPLVERCFLALTTAISFHYGGIIQGGSGVGKRETIQQLGKLLGRYVINMNLSSSTDSRDLNRICLGLIQTGSWAVLNNVEHLQPHLLPLLAAKLALITKVKSENLDKLMLDGLEIKMEQSCGVFIAFKTELNEKCSSLANLMAVMRPVAMIRPDVKTILEMRLFLCGFENSMGLAVKIEQLFSTAKERACSENHYKFSLASMAAVVDQAFEYKLVYKKRLTDPEAIVKALQNITMSALSQEEQFEFGSLIKQQFPSDSPLKMENAGMEEMIRISAKELGFQNSERLVKQCLRLHEMMQLYQVTIIIGHTGCGKSVIRKVLKTAVQLYQRCRVNEFVINPGTVGPHELLGCSHPQSGKWKEGILTKILKSQRTSQSRHQRESSQESEIDEVIGASTQEEHPSLWIVLDGQVEGSFTDGTIQQMLTLINYKNITLNAKKINSIKSQISIIIETDELRLASPSLIAQSRVIFIDEDPTSWKLPFRSWLNGLPKSMLKSEISTYFPKLMEKCLAFSIENCTTHFGSARVASHGMVNMFINLMRSFSVELEEAEKVVEGEEDEKLFSLLVQQVAGFCIAWSVFGILTEESQQKVSAFLKDQYETKVFPTKGTVFDYYFEFKARKWKEWKCLLADPSGLYSQHFTANRRSIVDTETTVRIEYFLGRFEKRCPTLIVGYSNSGKSNIIASALNSQQEENLRLHIQMTPKLRGSSVQSLIESRLERVSSLVLSPSGGKKLTVFIDDLHAYSTTSLSELHDDKSRLSTLPTSSYCEFLRTLIEHRMWYDRKSGVAAAISNLWIVAASTLNKGGNSSFIPARLQSKFALVYVPLPDEFQLRKIFTSKLTNKLSDFTSAVKLLADDLTVATLDTYNKISSQLPPVPSNPFHTFSIHDVSRVYEGFLRANKEIQETKNGFVRLWFHELSRVFLDRLIDSNSRQKFRDILTEQLLKHFELQLSSLFPQTGGHPTVFGTFMRGTGSKLYQEIKDQVALGNFLKKAIGTTEKNGKSPTGNFFMERNIVLFRAAVVQTTRIARVMSMTKGHLINYGEGGQGRKMLTRLVATILGFVTFDFSNTFHDATSTVEFKNGPVILLKGLLKDAYRTCVVKNVGCCVLLTDEHISEDILELISTATSTVEIPDLYTKKELQEMMSMMGQGEINGEQAKFDGRKLNGSIAEFLDLMKERIEQNLHIVLCVNPKNATFRKGIIQNPSLLKQMSVSWFDIWRRESFLEVAKILLPPSNEKAVQIESDDPISTGSIFCTFHSIAEQLGKKAVETGLLRFACITQMHFIHFVELYILIKNELTTSVNGKLDILRNAMIEINGIQAKIGSLTEQAINAEKKAQASRDECHNLLEIVEKQETDTNRQEAIVNEKRGQLRAQEKEFEQLGEVIKKKWTDCLEGFEEVNYTVQDISDEDITHIRSYYSPPPLVSRVLDAVMIMLDRDQTWPEAKIQIGHPDFMRKILDFDKASVTMEKLDNLRVFLQNPEFTPEAIAKYSNGARLLCAWIHAVDKYCRTYLTHILPKREKLEEQEQSVTDGRFELELNEQKLELLNENLGELQTNYEAKLELKECYEKDSTHWNEILERAESVLQLLKVDQRHWEEEMGQLKMKFKNVQGDSLLSSACLAYLGPFDGEFRNILKTKWLEEIERRKVASSLSTTKVNESWSIDKLMTNTVCMGDFAKSDVNLELVKNVLILGKANGKLLIVDPFESFDGTSREAQMATMISPTHETLPDCGNIPLFKIIHIYNTSLDKLENTYQIEESDDIVEDENEHPPPKHFLITRNPNPEFGSEINSQFYVINMNFSSKGLTEYLVSRLAQIVVPDVESRKQFLLQRDVDERRKISELKENIPALVLSYSQSMLNNGDFPKALTKLKTDHAEAVQKQKEIQLEIHKLKLKLEQFLPMAKRLQRIYTALCDVSLVLPEYEISPKLFVTLMGKIINKFQIKRSPDPEGEDAPVRKNLADVMQFLEGDGCKILLRQLTQSMFRRDRHLFALLLCIAFDKNPSGRDFEMRPTLEELSFLSRTAGDIVTADVKYFPIENDDGQSSGAVEDGICSEGKPEKLRFFSNNQVAKLEQIEKLKNYEDLLKSIKENEAVWEIWMKYFEPENKFPDTPKLDSFQKLVILSILRPDRFPSKIKILVEEVLGSEYDFLTSGNNPVDLSEIYHDIAATDIDNTDDSLPMPIVFLLDENLSGQVDPLPSIQALSRSLKPPHKLYPMSASPETTNLAWKLLEEAIASGYWVYFSNCHLADEEWLSGLGERFENFKETGRPHHPDFRLWLSTTRNVEKFPMNVLRNSLKIPVEPPQNLPANMARLFQKMSAAIPTISMEEESAHAFNRLLYGLSYIHCNLTGRRKFSLDPRQTKELIFQDIDFEISSAILKLFVANYSTDEMPWWGVKLLLDLQYNGHFSIECTSSKHHNLVGDLLKQVICKVMISQSGFRFYSTCNHPLLTMPDNGDLISYHKYIMATCTNHPENDNPEIYGYHPNIDVWLNTDHAKIMLHSLGQILSRMVNKLTISNAYI